jgi:integrase
MAELADKLRNKTLTVGEALDLATKDAPQSRINNIRSFGNKLKRLGIEDSAPFSSIGEAANLELLAQEKGEPFKALTTVQNAVNKAAAAQDIENPFPDYSAKAQSAGLVEGKQKRGSLAFKGVPESKFSMPAIMEAIKNIEDPDTRAAVAFNALIPLRVGGENGLTSLTFDDIDLDNGVIRAAGSGNKYRPEIVLPPVARAILEDQAAQAKAQGRSRIFNTTREKMTQAVNAPGGMRDAFAEFERRMGRKLAGIKDLRKIIPSILAYELGYKDLVSKILGHESPSAIMGEMAKMTSDYYTSPVFKIDEVEPETVALRAVENLFASTANMEDLRELPLEMNVSATKVTESNQKFPVVPQGQDLLEGSTPIASTPQDEEILQARREKQLKEIAAQGAEAEAREETARRLAQEERLKQAQLTPEQEEKLARQRLAKQEASQKVKAEAKAQEADADLNSRLDKIRKAASAAVDTITDIGGKALKGVAVLGAAELAGRVGSRILGGEYGAAVAEVGTEVPPLQGFAHAYLRSKDPEFTKRQELERQYGTVPVFTAEALFGRGKQEESPQPSTKDQMDSLGKPSTKDQMDSLGISPDSSYP